MSVVTDNPRQVCNSARNASTFWLTTAPGVAAGRQPQWWGPMGGQLRKSPGKRLCRQAAALSRLAPMPQPSPAPSASKSLSGSQSSGPRASKPNDLAATLRHFVDKGNRLFLSFLYPPRPTQMRNMQLNQSAEIPPVMLIACPVIFAAAGEAKKTARPASSSLLTMPSAAIFSALANMRPEKGSSMTLR